MKTKIPFLIVILQMVGGVFISILFGINEDIFKGKIKSDLKSNPKIAAISDPAARKAKFDKEASKNWRYYQRYHFHSTGIGAMSLSVLLLLLFCHGCEKFKLLTSYSLSVGGFLYPFIWLFAGMYGPIMGRTEAKEAFAFFGYMGAVFLLGLLMSGYLIVRYPLVIPKYPK